MSDKWDGLGTTQCWQRVHRRRAILLLEFNGACTHRLHRLEAAPQLGVLRRDLAAAAASPPQLGAAAALVLLVPGGGAGWGYGIVRELALQWGKVVALLVIYSRLHGPVEPVQPHASSTSTSGCSWAAGKPLGRASSASRADPRPYQRGVYASVLGQILSLLQQLRPCHLQLLGERTQLVPHDWPLRTSITLRRPQTLAQGGITARKGEHPASGPAAARPAGWWAPAV